jgi:PAS domain S-box-containing protein
MSQGVLVCGTRGELLRMNGAAERVLGASFAQLREPEARGALLRLQGADGTALAVADTPMGKALQGEEVREVELRLHKPGGEETFVETSAAPIRGSAGEVRGAVVTFRDVTERRRAQELLRRYELLARMAQDVVLFVRREDGRLLDANAAAVAAYGYTHDELLRLRVGDLRAPGSERLTEQQMAIADAQGVRFEAVHRRKDGSTFPVEVSSVGATLNGARTLMSVVRDITVRARAEEALRASEAALRDSEDRLRLAIEAAGVGTWDYDPATRKLTFYAGRDVTYGLSRYQAADYSQFIEDVNPEDRARVHEAVTRALDPDGDGRYRAEYRWRRSDGVELWVVATGQASFASSDGRRTAVRLVGTVVDITDRRRAEEELREADRRKTEFLAVLSHELRNPLAPIRNAIHIMDRAPDGDAARRSRDVLRRQTDHLTRLVDDLLDITRITHGKVELQRVRLDAREVVRQAWSDARELFEQRDVELLLEEPPEPLWVEADGARLGQMISNVLSNALKFTPARGHVRIASVRQAAGCEIRVQDDGIGIGPGDLQRIFEPFVQVDRPRHTHGGMGIGLALVREFALKHGGTVRAESAGPGQGAEFVIELPSVSPPAGRQASRGPDARAAGLSVLIVEDNADAAETLAELLELSGHRVRTVGLGRAGVEAVAAGAPDVLLCDIGLPDMTGHDVIRDIRATPAGRRLFGVALTGYAPPRDPAAPLAAGFDAHLAKPPPLEELEQLLADVAARRA